MYANVSGCASRTGECVSTKINSAQVKAKKADSLCVSCLERDSANVDYNVS